MHLSTLRNTMRPHSAHVTFHISEWELKDWKILPSFRCSYVTVLRVKPQESFQRLPQHSCDEMAERKKKP